MRVRIHGFGNPGRSDDGLGPALIEALDRWLPGARLDGVDTDADYQLNLEDAAAMNGREIVLFADATKEPDVEPFAVTRVMPSAEVSFSLHSVSPGFLLNLCRQIYGTAPAAFLLHMRGYEWEIGEGLSAGARRNLDAATAWVKDWLASGDGSGAEKAAEHFLQQRRMPA